MFKENRSILILLFLAFSLQSAQAQVPLKSVSDLLYNWFQENKPVSVIFLGAAAILSFTTMYYLFAESKKKTEQTKKLKNYEIVTIKVKNQGSNAQCGYYALRNGFIVLDKHRHNETVSTKDSRFEDPKNQDIIFEQQTWENILENWKQIIAIFRKKNALKIWLKEKQFLPCLKKQKDRDQLWFSFRGVLIDLANGIANSCIETFGSDEQSPSPLQYNNKTLNSLLTDAIKKDNFGTQLENNREKYLEKFSNLSFEITAQDATSIWKKKYSNPYEDIDGDEIRELLHQTSNIEELRQHFTIAEDIDQLAISENASSAKEKWNNQSIENSIHIFCIGNMKEKNINSSGHWFMVVAEKLNSRKTFYTADSIGTDRTQDKRVQKIIQYLESK